MTWPAVKRGFSQELFRVYVNELSWPKWRPNKIVWHNTAGPSLKQWMASAKLDVAKDLLPGMSRIKNLELFFKDNNHWTGCPHLFVANDLIWVMNPLTEPGVHSPSWNSTSIGIEMVGDFASEDDDAGEGLRVKNNTIFATAVLCSAIGLEPTDGEVINKITRGSIFLHKQDTKTTHDCPGRDIAQNKAEMVKAVQDLMAGGEHKPSDVENVIAGAVAKVTAERRGIVTIEGLNFRSGPGVSNRSTGALNTGVKITILDTATSWLKVKTPAGHIGWVAGKFVQQEKEA